MGDSDKEINDKDFVLSNKDEDDESSLDNENEAYEPFDDSDAKPSLLPSILTGVGVFILIILSIMVLTRAQDLAEKDQVRAIESRLDLLERKLAGLDQINEQFGLSESPQNQLNLLNDRMAKLEAGITSELDRMRNDLGALTSIIAAKQPAEAEALRPAEQEKKEVKPTVHRVRAGDTLYRISRRYGLTVEQLQKYNKLTSDSKIYPGQKLKLTP